MARHLTAEGCSEGGMLTNFIKKIDIKKNIKIFRNSRYKLGSIVSLVCAGKFFHTKGDLIFMDGDVFYDKKVLKKLINSKIHRICDRPMMRIIVDAGH